MKAAAFPIVRMCCILTLLAPSVCAGEQIRQLLLAYGEGVQADADQRNSQLSVDYTFYQHRRSLRQTLGIGTGYTRLRTDAATNTEVHAFSLYPQLTLWPLQQRLPQAFFFVRALGPSYLNANTLGSRRQAQHFAFQAQVGVGYRLELDSRQAVLMQLSFKHFSNANLFHDNDGIDIPFVLTLGLVF